MKKTLYLGPPGTGKTTTLLDIVEDKLDRDIAPQQIAFITFTKKAAEEASKRARQKFGFKETDLIYFRTLHALCYRQLGLNRHQVLNFKTNIKQRLEFSNLLGWPMTGKTDPDDADDQVTKADQCYHLENLARTTFQQLKKIWQDQNLQNITLYEIDFFEQTYKKYKNKESLLDFTDFLQQSLEKCSPIKDLKIAFIDEAQDLTPLQWAVIELFFKNVDQLYIAGDDDQAIYTWAGADIDHFLKLGATKKVLKQSYRLPLQVFCFANEISKKIQHRYKKDFKPKKEKGKISHQNFVRYLPFETVDGSWLLLMRNWYLSNYFTHDLRQKGLTYLKGNNRSIKEDQARAIYAWTHLQQGRSITPFEANAILKYVKTPECFELKQQDKFTLKDFPSTWHKSEWFSLLDAIPYWHLEYFRAVLRRDGNLKTKPRFKIGTIHSSKGGEADNVVLLSDISYASLKDMDVNPDNEHRVFYVGATRARKNLFIISPHESTYYQF